MKKRLITTVILITTLLSYSQEEQPKEKTEIKMNPEWTIKPKWIYYDNGKHFQFIKAGTSKLETCDDGLKRHLESYRNANYDKLISKTKEEQEKYFELAKKYYLGATILTNPDDTIGNYTKLIDIPETDKFVLIATELIVPHSYLIKSEKKVKENPFNSSKPEIYYVESQKTPYFYGNDGYYNTREKTKVLIQNLKTNLYYIVNQDALNFSYQECQNLKFKDFSQIYKVIPKELSQSEKDFLAQYKTIIKTAKSKTVVLGTIQRKYLTRGYFDPKKVNAVDKKTYNKTLAELKNVAKQLSDIDKQDTNDKAQDMLTIEEIAVLSDVNNWNHNYYPIN